ncbi:hypothetical protein [Caulobacter sp. NIBR1757]|uniref:hypothetical protein n=1 Tax=Caulobacter sp. NIBR1757 TaxID=3016000 RepID=UPI0022F07FB3|nr:hypothetical protein [Caulobacter sp. NIBR1757]WGM40698.1 hypothetical protein AMEJIAPC_03645 [Caulobacter sp. NIBR1757]
MRALQQTRAGVAAVLAVLVLSLSGGGVLAQDTPPAPAEQAGTATAPQAQPPAPKTEAPAPGTETPAGDTDQDTANDQTPGPGVYDAVFKTLFIAMVLALVLESALAVVFNWRPFLYYFDGRGVRTPVSFGFALAIAGALQFDLVTRLYIASQADPVTTDLGPVGYILTGLVLAGGSSAVNTILRGLGLRQMGAREDVVARPPPTMAWISVSLTRKTAVGPVEVFVTDAGGVATLVGMITGDSHPPGLLRWLIRDDMRFPTAGGHALLGNADYSVSVAGKDRNGQPVTDTWGPFHIGAGAIVDLTLTA